jgi:hypothetical protein
VLLDDTLQEATLLDIGDSECSLTTTSFYATSRMPWIVNIRVSPPLVPYSILNATVKPKE